MYYFQRALWPYLSLVILSSCFPNLANAETLDDYPALSAISDSATVLDESLNIAPESDTQSTIEIQTALIPEASSDEIVATSLNMPLTNDSEVAGVDAIDGDDDVVVTELLNISSAEHFPNSFISEIPADATLTARLISSDIDSSKTESFDENDFSNHKNLSDDSTSTDIKSKNNRHAFTISDETVAANHSLIADNLTSNTLPDGAVPRSVVISPLSPKVSGNNSDVSQVNTSPIQIAQALPPNTPSSPESLPSNLQDIQRPPQEPVPDAELLPPLEEILDPEIVDPSSEESETPSIEESVEIQRYDVQGSTVFSTEELEEVTRPFTTPVKNRPITFSEVLEARSAVTQLYLNNDYITSGAIVPTQEIIDGVAIIQVIEGSLEDIEIIGTRRLNPGYIRSRLAIGAAPPLDVEKLLEKIQLLPLDPLIENISVDLQAGTESGTNLLVVEVTEADSFEVNYTVDNNRSPSVGTVRHQLQVNERNLFGLGDNLRAGYTLTSGSDSLNADYTLPLSPHNTTLNLAVNLTDSNVREDPFDVLDISSESDSYQITLRHPLIEKPQQEFALGLTASHQRSQTSLGIDDIGPFPLSPGADDRGRTKVSALRFFQEWTQRNNNQVVALRSQFNVGLDVLDATVNSEGPDSRFFSWQGQSQWVRRIGSENLLLVRGGVQLSTDSLLTLEQFGLGGQSTVRGFRQDQLLTDNGALASVELRFPIARDHDNTPLLQLTPFLDAGIGWNNNGDNPDSNTLIGIGTGLLLDTGDLIARLDWGIPLTETSSDRDSLQENGIYFSLSYSFF